MIEVIKNTVSITVFVTIMMMVIEYFNVRTKGSWGKVLKQNKFVQVIIATILGIIPGCLGAFTVVSMFTHGMLSFGALVAAMIATFGDEAFIMFAVMPDVTIKMSVVLILLAIVTGFITNLFVKDKGKDHHFHVHKEHCEPIQRVKIINNLKHISFQRAILLFSVITSFIFILASEHKHGESFDMDSVAHKSESINNNVQQSMHTEEAAHDHNNHIEHDTHAQHVGHDEHGISWVKITYIFLLLITFIIVLIVPEHFLEEHLWRHVIKKHFLKVLLWTFGVLILVYFSKQYFDFDQFISNNIYIVLLVALLIGIIPESGPHLIFISLFLSGAIPLSILMASSIVQDGHGALPLFAEDKKSFFAMKAINIFVAGIVGLIGINYGL